MFAELYQGVFIAYLPMRQTPRSYGNRGGVGDEGLLRNLIPHPAYPKSALAI